MILYFHFSVNVVLKLLRVLVIQLEDAEYATAAAVKARKGVELELQEVQHQMDALSKSKQDVSSAIVLVTSKLLCINCTWQMYINNHEYPLYIIKKSL